MESAIIQSALSHTCPAVSTSWRWYSCPFIVIILVNAAVKRKDKLEINCWKWQIKLLPDGARNFFLDQHKKYT